MRLSVVIPLFNEEENVRPLVEEVRTALGDGTGWELLLIDDGSVDDTASIVHEIASEDPRVGLIQLARNYGQTTAIQAGFDRARGQIVVTMDGDLQNDPRDIPALITRMLEGYDLVSGWREHRKEAFLTRRLPSIVANRLISLVTGIQMRDLGCGIKAYRRDLLDRIALYSDMHRFIPIVAASVAAARITEIPVEHRLRRRGESKYGLSRIWKVLGDILTITMIRWFRERPLVMFALGAAGALGLATVLMIIAVLEEGGAGEHGTIVIPGAIFLQFGLAFYLIMLGLISEAVVHRLSGSGQRRFSRARQT